MLYQQTAILLIPFLGTSLGSAMVFFTKNKINEKFQKFLLGFASGVMIAASVWSRPQPQLSVRQAEANQPFAILFQGFGMLTEVISDWAVLMYGNTVWTAL